MPAYQIHTVILPGHRIEIQDSGLPEGCSATVVIRLEGQDAEVRMRSFEQLLAEAEDAIEWPEAELEAKAA